ncbi:hypothetical protein SUDANB105_07769 [Streptomyces sp. enrichment culture]|uniref:hypothetical protein n=1 Tax=Streptomyces sp. enrichment culture TaxID=1795815 RepID=UPI003F5430C9
MAVARDIAHPHASCAEHWQWTRSWLASRTTCRAARQVCAECDYDLREFKDESRLPYDIRLPERPTKRRLVCGQCCNDGVDEMKRLAALAGNLS